jgi:hypothetical protein
MNRLSTLKAKRKYNIKNNIEGEKEKRTENKYPELIEYLVKKIMSEK